VQVRRHHRTSGSRFQRVPCKAVQVDSDHSRRGLTGLIFSGLAHYEPWLLTETLAYLLWQVGPGREVVGQILRTERSSPVMVRLIR
jgi:hypothetical protein